MSGGVAPMPATPEHPGDYDSSTERVSSEPPPDCPSEKRSELGGYDGDPQDPAPPITSVDSTNAGGKTGCITATAGWTDSGVFTTSCTSDTQEIITFGGMADHDSATVVVTSSMITASASADIDTIAPGHSPAVVNGCSKIPKKNGAA